MPTNSNIIPVKYVFLDVVAYTKRTIEAQCYIIEALNRIVKGTTNRYHISNDSLIYIPTGDGMCIALLGIDLPYDIHVTIATEILRRVWVNNSRVKYNWRKFEVRRGKEIFYWKNSKHKVDFVIKEGLQPSELIQVCWDVTDEKTKKREIEGLLEAIKTFKLKQGLILTEDHSETKTFEKKKIYFVPIWKWLLSNKR